MSETTCPKCGSKLEIRDCLVCECQGHVDDGLCPSCGGDGQWIVPHDIEACLRAQLTAALSAKEAAEQRVGELEAARDGFRNEIEAATKAGMQFAGGGILVAFDEWFLAQPSEHGQRP